jgi:2-hydroxymethylglutarate dehydrogenase
MILSLKEDEKLNIGFIGTGAMGKPMARNLAKAGHALTVYARHPEKVADLASAGAAIAESPAEVAATCAFIVLCLPFDPEVEEVVFGPQGIATTARPNTILLDSTTGTVGAAQRLAEKLASQKIIYLDAPISGGVKGAADGTLTFMVGGDPAAVEKAEPLMKAMGPNIYKVGPVGSGRSVKTLNQIIAAVNTLILCETVVLGKKTGVSPQTIFDVLGKSSANSFHMQTKMPQFIIPGRFEGGFRIDLMVKDLEIAMQASKDLQTPMMITGLANQLYKAAAGSGYGGKDTSSMVNFLGGFVGLDFKAP